MMWTVNNILKLVILMQSQFTLFADSLIHRNDTRAQPNIQGSIALDQASQNLDNDFVKKDDTLITRKGRYTNSPFLFLCHSPRLGEPTDIGDSDVRVSLDVTGEKKLDAGYESQVVYELLITSNVQLDGFLLTGVHAITKAFTQSNFLHLPPSTSGMNSAGNICAFLHSHISKKPRSKISLMWMAPPSGTGCVIFLATGSLQGRLLFKDLIIKEICEKGQQPLEKLKEKESFLTSKNESGFVFRDDFEDIAIDYTTWNELNNGQLGLTPLDKQPGQSLIFNGAPSSVQTRPMDFSTAKHLQFTLGPGNCNHGGKVRLSFGSTSPLPKKVTVKPVFTEPQFGPDKIDKGNLMTEEESGSAEDLQSFPLIEEVELSSSFVSPKISEENYHELTVASGDQSEVQTAATPDLFEESSGAALAENLDTENDEFSVNEGSGSVISILDIIQNDEPVSSSCLYWETIEIHEIPTFQEVHSRAIPTRFQRKGICLKWEMDNDIKLETETKDSCWFLDNIATVTKESQTGPLVDHFDPIDPSNWLFFPGGRIQETCGSEGNSLFFDGFSTDNWVSTRQINISESNYGSESAFSKMFSNTKEIDGWHMKGARDGCTEDTNTPTFFLKGKRELCSPYLDGSPFTVIKVLGGVSKCSSEENATIGLYVDMNGERLKISDIVFKSHSDVIVLPLTSDSQRAGIKICLQQFAEIEGEFAWNIREMVLLPWMPSKPKYFFQVKINLNCDSGESKVDIEASSNGGKDWWSLHQRCVPGSCEATSSAINPMSATGIDEGWTLVTLPLPYIALTPHTKFRIRQLDDVSSIWKPKWAIDYIYVGECPQGCNGHGQCYGDAKCKCEYGYIGEACEISERRNPVYISEQFVGSIEASANIHEVSGGETSYQCGIVGLGAAAVFKGRGPRYLTTVDLDTKEAHMIHFNFRAGTFSEVGKCPGPDKENEGIYIHYSCTGGATWHLLRSLEPQKYKEPSHINIPLPLGARNSSCRFQIWQADHSGSGRDMWAIDDLTVTSQRFNTIELSFEDGLEVNNSLRFHLGKIGDSCERNHTMIFSGQSTNGLVRFLETKSVSVGPSYMMQFDLIIGCGTSTFSEQLNSTVVLEYSLNHGLTWNLVQRPCTPSTPGCESHFTRGTVYHVSEFHEWKRVTLRLPQHTWSPTTRLRLRQVERSDVGLPWSLDNFYIGHQCEGLCSGHGYCTTRGCRCDDKFHGHKCLPLHKLHKEIDADFDQEDHLTKYSFHVIGGSLAGQFEGCGTVVSGNNLYFGTPGIRHFETDDINAEELHGVMFVLVIGGDHGLQRACQSSREMRASSDEEVSFGSVVLEYSLDGGISWDLLKEMIRSEYRKPKPFSLILEEEILQKMKTASGIIRFRLWQPKHKTEDQWALDNFIVERAEKKNTLQADFREGAAILSPWLSTTKYSQKKYCDSENLAQVMDSTDPVRTAVTNRLSLNESDVISFQISVGCSHVASEGYPVRLEFSRDGGNSWDLVNKGCLPKSLECKGPEEPSIYWPGHHGPWQRVLIPVDHKLTHGDVQIRWTQDNAGETRRGEFALRQLYIGPACKYSCMGHGMCRVDGSCKCDKGYSGKFCGLKDTPNTAWLRDGFESETPNSDFWENADGAVVSAGCNPDHVGNVIFFNGDNHRFISTRELDTRNIKYLVFDLQIGANNYESRCQKGEASRDNVVVEMSTDNGLFWEMLQDFEPMHTINRKRPFFVRLPRRARTKQTKFRWWQPPPYLIGETAGFAQAEWQLDNVMVMANETIPLNMMDDFSSELDERWFMSKGDHREKGCGKNNPSLVFSSHSPARYTETWDFKTSKATVLQFDVMPSCEKRKVPTEIHVEYTTDNGKTWHLVKNGCYPPNSICDTHDLPSIYSSKEISEWERITLKIPNSINGERTRVRFRQERGEDDTLDPSSSWAIDNIFIGESCPWMCSGQGYCKKNKCECDEGFFGDFCVPSKVLPCEALDTFNQGQINDSVWKDVQGAEISDLCGSLVSKTALVFFKEGSRYATTIDLDMTGGQFIQFTLLMGCHGNGRISRQLHDERRSRISEKGGSILVQFSTNGGITWTDLKNIRFHTQNEAAFISIELHDFPESHSNATRFRVWQPQVHNSMVQVWAIDNLFIGGSPINPNVLFEDFNSDAPIRDAWIDWPAGQLRPMCNSLEPKSALVFGSEEGEHSIYTKDLAIDEHSLMQFDIKVGCGNLTINAHNVTLEYSTDFGLTWTPLRIVKHLFEQSPDYLHELQTPTIYYPNSARGWKRVTIPLKDMRVCGNVRFRWWQNYYYSREISEEWGIDNVYIGPSCHLYCSGHGYCINGHSCICDEAYDGGDHCFNIIQNDQEILEDFEGSDALSKFLQWSGAEISSLCDVLSDESLLFWQQGERMLVTRDLDLTYGSVVQFYIRMDCSNLPYDPAREKDEPIILQFSSDGGIVWNLISSLSEDAITMDALPNTRHFTISLPEPSKTNSTRLRWWQPSQDGRFESQWAIDQIYIGSVAKGITSFFDQGDGDRWLLRPGSQIENACDMQTPSIHFAKNNGVRFSETPDIKTNRRTFLQFEISIGCEETNHCFGKSGIRYQGSECVSHCLFKDIFLEYSIDHGKTWQNIRESCLPSDPDCQEFWPSSTMPSDLYNSLTQVTLTLPERARSKLARFRFSQKIPWDSQHSWLISRVYIGNDCPQLCSGRGFCEADLCRCHDGWTGKECEKRLTDLPQFIADDFTSPPSSSNWKQVVGAKISEICGAISSEEALHFYGGCSRLLESVDIDLREALFIQFDFQTGCLDKVTNETSSGNNSVLVQISCNGGITWSTLRRLPLLYHEPKYVWIEIPKNARCVGGRVRWWQPASGPRSNHLDWALDSIIIGGRAEPPSSISLISPEDLDFPLWLRGYNAKKGSYCELNDIVQVMESTPSEPAIIQTSDIEITPNHAIHFRLALGCGALWDNSIEPVSLEFSKDFGRSWKRVRELCLPFNTTSCSDLHDESVFYAPQEWQYYVIPLDHIGPYKYVRFRWIQNETADVMGTHKWAIRDVYIGLLCPHHCLGRGSCINQTCNCEENYSGDYCQNILIENIPYIKDTFNTSHFQDHWRHIQGALLGPGCGDSIEEPPAATFQGPHTRALMSKPIDTRSARFILFTAQIGSHFGRGLCRQPDERLHNVFLQYSVDGGIKWYLLRELDNALYRKPREDYIVIPRHAMTPATIFRFWQPRLSPTPPTWAVDDVFIGGSEIGAAQILENFDEEITVSEWLFAPHSHREGNYCQRGNNGSLVWEADYPGHRAITTQELLIQEGHILQFKISVGCQEVKADCYKGPQVQLKFTKEGGARGWDLVRDSCLPETSPDPDCFPYTFHGPSVFVPDLHSSWTRITIPLPEKTWSSTTQLRWVQEASREGGQVERILPWALDDVYIGIACPMNCRGRGNCINGKCICDPGYEGPTCEPHLSHMGPLPTSLIEGFEGVLKANWATVTGGNIGLGCNSLAPYGHGKHLYFNGCGTRQAISYDLDTRRATKVMFVLRIGSHDGMRSCRINLSDPKRIENKGVIFQYSPDNGITWTTIDVHNPLDFRKPRRVAYSLPSGAQQNGVKLRWWQPDHDGPGTDQWALDNVEIVLAQRKPTHQYNAYVYHLDDL